MKPRTAYAVTIAARLLVTMIISVVWLSQINPSSLAARERVWVLVAVLIASTTIAVCGISKPT